MKIRYQLLLTHGLLVILSVIIVLLNVLVFRGMTEDASSINNLAKLRYYSYNMSHITNQIQTADKDEIIKFKKLITLKIQDFEEILFYPCSKGKPVTNHWETMDKLRVVQKGWLEDFKPLLLKVDIDTELEIYKKINDFVDPFVENIDDVVSTYSAYSKGKIITALKLNGFLVFLIFLVTTYSFVTTNDRIRKPLDSLLKELKDFSFSGIELPIPIEEIGSDEFSEMGHYFHIMMFDQLTKSFNRKAGLARLNGLIYTKDGRQFKMSICFADINGLKDVNDHLGHKYGDELIVSTVNCMKNAIREEDFIIRMGGDEFLIVLNDIGTETAEKVWERINNCYQEINEKEDRPYLISVSHGIAEYNSLKNPDLEEIIRIADKRMYQEKEYIKKVLKPTIIKDIK